MIDPPSRDLVVGFGASGQEGFTQSDPREGGRGSHWLKSVYVAACNVKIF